MKKGKSNVPKPTPARMALASNLRQIMTNYDVGRGITPQALSEALGKAISHRTIKRMLDPYGTVDPNLDSLDELAYFFKIDTWKLLQPHHGTVTSNTPTGRSDIKVKS